MGMNINWTSGMITWVPDNSHVGSNSVTVRVDDYNGASAFQSFTVTVANVNQAPEITSGAQTWATEDQNYTYFVEASDPDGDSLTYSLTQAPSGMTIGSANGIVQWTPDNSQVGSNAVTIRVADGGGLYDTQSFSVQVANVNDDPVITSSPITWAMPDHPYDYQVEANDPDGDSLNYSLDQAPDGMYIDAASGWIYWHPMPHQEGTHTVTVRVDDYNGGQDTQTFEILVGW